MDERLKTMLQKYHLVRDVDYINALKEIIQEIALLGLYRANFFDKAAFYGGTALRILYGLDRYSEDLDFSLKETDKSFSLDYYNKAVEAELNSFGLESSVSTKNKSFDSQIISAFIKAGTKKQLVTIKVPDAIANKFHHAQNIKVKMEVDIDPPGNFLTEVKRLLLPIPFSVKTYQQPDLFAGKIHAILCRKWLKRVKGRDWYDLVWYLARNTPVRLMHLEQRLIQSGHSETKTELSQQVIREMLNTKIDQLDIESAKQDVLPFIKDPDAVKIWSRDFFHDIVNNIKVID